MSLAPLIKALFFLSGAFALVYELCWVRVLTLEFGATTPAVATVLSLFMGGLALGATLAGRRADRWSRPLAAYGLLEIGLGLFAAITPWLHTQALPQFGVVASKLFGGAEAVVAARCLGAALLLLPPTVIMGATLPVLARYGAARGLEGERWAGLLYGINTLGAFSGTLAAGFLFLPAWGLSATLWTTAACNLLLGLCAGVIGWRSETPGARREAEAPVGPAGRSAPVMALYLAVGLTGFSALACEVIWTRVLSMVLGPSVYAFTVVLATFLCALGAGAALASDLIRRLRLSAHVAFGLLAMLAAFLVCFTSESFQYLPFLFLKLFWRLGVGGAYENVFYVQFLLAGIVLFPPALIMGALFPVALKAAAPAPAGTSRAVGLLYAWNTVGCIVGSWAAGFILIPLLGIRGALLTAAAAQCLAGVIAASNAAAPRSGRCALAGGAGLMAVLAFLAPGWDPLLMTSGIYHYAVYLKPSRFADFRNTLAGGNELLFYRDGLSSTVTVLQSLPAVSGHLSIASNGKIEGSSSEDMLTQRLVAHVPLLFHNDPQEICVIGLGTGCTAGSASLHPARRVVVAEIEKAMVAGAEFFADYNHGVHRRRNVRILETDGRLYLKTHPARFDVVISEPSNPWLAGTSDLFTREYFEIARRALKPDGLFCAWVQVYRMAPENYRTIVRTFLDVFPNTWLLSTVPYADTLLLAFPPGGAPDFDIAARRLNHDPVKKDLAAAPVGISGLYDLAARFRMGPDALRTLAGTGIRHTDDRPVIAYRAPRDLYRDSRKENVALLAQHATGIAPHLAGRDVIAGIDRRAFLEQLAGAYQRFLPGGNEERNCRALLDDRK